MLEYEKKEAETSLEEMICAILYLNNSGKCWFSGLKKHGKNDYVLNKPE